MSGKQNYKTSNIGTFYAKNIFRFDGFCDFEFFSGSENLACGSFAVSFATGGVNRKLQNQEKQSRGKINFGRQKN